MQLTPDTYLMPPSGDFLSPDCVPKYVTNLVIPPPMPAGTGTHRGPGCYNFHGLKSPDCYPKHYGQYGPPDECERQESYYPEPEGDEYQREEYYPKHREEYYPKHREEYYPKPREEYYPKHGRHGYRARAEGASATADAANQEAPDAQSKALSNEEDGAYKTQYMGYGARKNPRYYDEERSHRGSYRGEEHYSEDYYPKHGHGYKKHGGYEYEPDNEGYGREEEPYGKRHDNYPDEDKRRDSYPDEDKSYGREYYAPWYNPKGKRYGFETCDDDYHQHAPKPDCETPDCFKEYSISTNITSQDVLPTKALCPTCDPVNVTSGPAAGRCPASFGKTDVFGYQATNRPDTLNWPAFTIESQQYKPNRIKWVNDFKNADGTFKKHVLDYAVDQTIHWANPTRVGGSSIDDSPCHDCTMIAIQTRNFSACLGDQRCVTAANTTYEGPIPIVTHVHGANGVRDYSDGFTEAWFLPAVNDLPENTSPIGTWYTTFEGQYIQDTCQGPYAPGTASYIYRNEQRPANLWYHDHTLGLTRLNVYAGLAGFYFVRKFFPTYSPRDTGPELAGIPYPPPGGAINPADVLELPLAIQDRVFQNNSKLWYPQAKVPAADAYPNGLQPPVWIPEFLFDPAPPNEDPMMMTVNGRTWPRVNLAPNTYRLRLLNGCNARVLQLGFARTNKAVTDFGDANRPTVNFRRMEFWVIGNEAGFFPAIQGPFTNVTMGQAERLDVIIDWSELTSDEYVYMINTGPEVPFNGVNVGTTTRHTSQVMRFEFRGVSNRKPCPFNWERREKLNEALLEEAVPNLPPATSFRRMALIEQRNPGNAAFVKAVLLGTVNPNSNVGIPQPWAESPARTDTSTCTVEEWEIINLTPDAHPIHLHEVDYQYISRTAVTVTGLNADNNTEFTSSNTPVPNPYVDPLVFLQNCPPELNDGGPCYAYRDVAQFLPGTATRIRFKTGATSGLFVWHCHLVEHEDNEMMVPWCIGDPGYTNPHTNGPMCPGAPSSAFFPPPR